MSELTSVLAPGSGLTDRQVIFCREYAKAMRVDSAERAAGIHDGYGSDLLKLPKVQDYIRWLVFGKKTSSIGPAKILRRTWELANSDISELDDVSSLTELRGKPAHVRRAVKKIKQREYLDKDGNTIKVETEIEMHPKMPALQLLAIATGAVRGELKDDGEGGFEGFTILTPQVKTIEGASE